MTFYGREDLDKLKSRVSLSDYLAHSGVSLTRAGRNLRANCPLHDDSTPSFYVKDDNSFYCYGCQSGGDIFTLTQQLYGLSFSDAVARVQEYAGGASVPAVQAPHKSDSKKLTMLSSDRPLLEDVVNHYQQKLAKNPQALKYLANRKISTAVVEKFQLGFGSGFLSKELQHSNDRLRKLGLVNSKDADSFYGRITVPIRDSEGDIRQLYGRSISSKNKHRYLPVAHKTLFHPDALAGSKVILCESILDALTFHSHGIENAIAVYSAGGLKPEFVRQLGDSSVRKVMIAYDSDEAGDKGAAKAGKALRSDGILAYRLGLAKGMDVNAVAVQADKPAETLEGLLAESRNNRL